MGEGLEVAGGEEEVNVFVVGGGRGGGEVGIFVPLVAGADGLPPQFLARLSVDAEAEEEFFLGVDGGDEDFVSEDGGGGGGAGGEGGGPFDAVCEGELGGEVLRLGGSILIRAAPLGPVFGVGGEGDGGGEG